VNSALFVNPAGIRINIASEDATKVVTVLGLMILEDHHSSAVT
jgi:hypothetical protein